MRVLTTHKQAIHVLLSTDIIGDLRINALYMVSFLIYSTDVLYFPLFSLIR